MAARTEDEVLEAMLRLLPTGWAWAGARDGWLPVLLRPIAAEVAALEAQADRLLEEADPRTADALLDAYERLLGEDPCVSRAGMSLGDRRAAAHAGWTARGVRTVPDFLALGRRYGAEISVTEQRVSCRGEAVCGDERVATPEQFVWVVTLPPTREWEAVCGASERGDRRGDFEPSPLECVIRRLAPPHTLPVFTYS